MAVAASWTAFDIDEKYIDEKYNVAIPLPTVLSTAFHMCAELHAKKKKYSLTAQQWSYAIFTFK